MNYEPPMDMIDIDPMEHLGIRMDAFSVPQIPFSSEPWPFPVGSPILSPSIVLDPIFLALGNEGDSELDRIDSAAEQTTTQMHQPTNASKMIATETLVSISGGALGGLIDETVGTCRATTAEIGLNRHFTPSTGGCDAELQVGAAAEPGVYSTRQVGVAKIRIALLLISRLHDACESETWVSFSTTEPEEPEDHAEGQETMPTQAME
ncbi:hypothetical protein N657DRAFT_633892 [Parathielavia appendiculata]|uniref:Uncharacterized protein n=1 Tax=Parathielavia appendiculata TaxID=2587402 RepID=A0AAN6TZK4_9PEZI|nr:hypothetical protein N657DRAFT_633892 [Parathielavia appendiculata]